MKIPKNSDQKKIKKVRMTEPDGQSKTKCRIKQVQSNNNTTKSARTYYFYQDSNNNYLPQKGIENKIVRCFKNILETRNGRTIFKADFCSALKCSYRFRDPNV